MGSLRAKAEAIHSAIEAISEDFHESLASIVNSIAESQLVGGKVLIFGNGGSAADSQHFAAELVSSLHGAPLPKPLRALALTTDTSVLTAIGNDVDFSHVFARQVEALCERGDVVIGLTTSGNSTNVLEGLRMGRQLGASTVAITSERGLQESLADNELRLPSSDTQVVQSLTLLALHAICEDLEEIRVPSSQ